MIFFSTPKEPQTLQEQLFGEPDWRVKEWLFLSSPCPFICILICYFSVIHFGRKIMEPRTPFNLRKVLLVYNAFQIIISLYIFKEIIATAYLSGYSLTCQNIERTLDPLPYRMAEAFWWFLASKVIDLLDTVFFVLRKKHQQLTFLHIYHHSSMLPNWYLGTLYLPGGQAYVSAALNSFVHIIMYCYYLLSAMGPSWQPYLWWKKYLTQMQLIQFFVVTAHILVGVYHSCDPPTWLTAWTLTYMCSMVALFFNFYYKTYFVPNIKKPESTHSSIAVSTDDLPEAETEDNVSCQVRPSVKFRSYMFSRSNCRGDGDKRSE
ncbi:hypothetical protein L9F63_000450 [Diploptera punctata]|uniref:Elongation of very long chain fatty acids protein n=1 Tax=Diploptera punctata TaxID=6984 RepID=A0AAD8AMN1_DIPPU|nr:hypothetical protein L9F63_000450 [Diploptera punctata]